MKILNLLSQQGDGNENTMRSPHTHQDGNKQNKRKLTSMDEDAEKAAPSFAAAGNVKQCSHCIKYFGDSLVS